MIEERVESHLKRRVRETGGEERKVVWPGRKGAPDRLVGWPNGRHGFVELKRPKGKAEAHQQREHERLRAIGFQVDVLDTREAVDEYVRTMSGFCGRCGREVRRFEAIPAGDFLEGRCGPACR